MTTNRDWRCTISPSSVVLASYEGLKNVCTSGYAAFVWPDEGDFTDSKWRFNEAHEGQFEPLLIDKVTANAMVTVHDALNAANQAKFEDWVGRHRGNFANLVEMTWERVSPKRAA
jgi:hypothetical protein